MSLLDIIDEAIQHLELTKYEFALKAYDRQCHKDMIEAEQDADKTREEARKLKRENEKLRAQNTRLFDRLKVCEPVLTFDDFIKDMDITKQINLDKLKNL